MIAGFSLGMTTGYKMLEVALVAQPDNDKTLADFALTALKTGRVGPAIEAADRVLAHATSPTAQAAAWFNKGLACEHLTERVLTYNGSAHCMGDRIWPFLRSWQIEAKPARAQKLRQLLQTDGADVCVTSKGDSPTPRYRFALDFVTHDGRHEQVERIYALHRSDESIDPGAIQWSVRFAGASEPTVVSPQIVVQVVLGADAVTVLEAKYYGQDPTINGLPCKISH